MIVLAARGQEGARYAYATYAPAGWLMRVHVTPKGNVKFEYTTPVHVFEGGAIYWMKYGALKKCKQDDEIKALDYSLDIPEEWKRLPDVGYPKDYDNECQKCGNSFRQGSLYCNANHTYTSPIMTCPRFVKKEPKNVRTKSTC